MTAGNGRCWKITSRHLDRDALRELNPKLLRRVGCLSTTSNERTNDFNDKKYRQETTVKPPSQPPPSRSDHPAPYLASLQTVDHQVHRTADNKKDTIKKTHADFLRQILDKDIQMSHKKDINKKGDSTVQLLIALIITRIVVTRHISRHNEHATTTKTNKKYRYFVASLPI